MDNKFYIDDFDFERYLKEKADEFRMYPSKRVWNSIYNNMHPGSRWPSVSMCIVLICTLFLVGFLNTTTPNKNVSNSLIGQTNPSSIPASYIPADLDKPVFTAETKNIAAQQATLTAPAKTGITALKNNPVANVQTAESNKNISNVAQPAIHNTTTPLIIASTNNNRSVSYIQASSNVKWNSVITGYTVSSEVTNAVLSENTENRSISNDADNLLNKDNLTEVSNQNGSIKKNDHYKIIAEKVPADLQLAVVSSNTIAAAMQSAKTATVNNHLSEADKFWIENYAMYNRPAPKKWKGKLSWQNYITPSVVYRSLENTAADKNVGLTGLANNSDINNSVAHTPSFGIEIGTGLQYDLSKRIKIKTGLQLNFTRYNAHAFDNGHPITTSLTMLNDNTDMAYQVYRISPYNSNYGINPVKLHNQTYQVSLPIGADYKIAAVNNLEWYAGATIQPTFVLGGRSYLISTDRRNYVKETDMLNRFNLNAGFETYISIKTKGFTWQIGPQFRRQLFSTNKKIYSIEERLLNYGLKIGISKKL